MPIRSPRSPLLAAVRPCHRVPQALCALTLCWALAPASGWAQGGPGNRPATAGRPAPVSGQVQVERAPTPGASLSAAREVPAPKDWQDLPPASTAPQAASREAQGVIPASATAGASVSSPATDAMPATRRQRVSSGVAAGQDRRVQRQAAVAPRAKPRAAQAKLAAAKPRTRAKGPHAAASVHAHATAHTAQAGQGAAKHPRSQAVAGASPKPKASARTTTAHAVTHAAPGKKTQAPAQPHPKAAHASARVSGKAAAKGKVLAPAVRAPHHAAASPARTTPAQAHTTHPGKGKAKPAAASKPTRQATT